MTLDERTVPPERDGHDPLPGLLAATAGGDRAAFSRLYALTSPKLMGIGVRLMRSRDEAEDLLQETYIKVWHKAHLYDPARGAPLVWLITILRRGALDRLRRTGRADRELPLDAPGMETRAELTVEDDPHEHARGRRVQRCLQELDASKRRAILLSFYYGLTHEELAERLDVPIGTVKSWIRRGLKNVKECLER